MPGPAEDDGPLTRRDAYNEVLFGYDSDYAYAVEIVKNLYLGPGEPGPEDEWNMPRGPLDQAVVEADDAAEMTRSGYGDWLGRLVGLLKRQPPE